MDHAKLDSLPPRRFSELCLIGMERRYTDDELAEMGMTRAEMDALLEGATSSGLIDSLARPDAD